MDRKLFQLAAAVAAVNMTKQAFGPPVTAKPPATPTQPQGIPKTGPLGTPPTRALTAMPVDDAFSKSFKARTGDLQLPAYSGSGAPLYNTPARALTAMPVDDAFSKSFKARTGDFQLPAYSGSGAPLYNTPAGLPPGARSPVPTSPTPYGTPGLLTAAVSAELAAKLQQKPAPDPASLFSRASRLSRGTADTLSGALGWYGSWPVQGLHHTVNLLTGNDQLPTADFYTQFRGNMLPQIGAGLDDIASSTADTVPPSQGDALQQQFRSNTPPEQRYSPRLREDAMNAWPYAVASLGATLPASASALGRAVSPVQALASKVPVPAWLGPRLANMVNGNFFTPTAVAGTGLVGSLATPVGWGVANNVVNRVASNFGVNPAQWTQQALSLPWQRYTDTPEAAAPATAAPATAAPAAAAPAAAAAVPAGDDDVFQLPAESSTDPGLPPGSDSSEYDLGEYMASPEFNLANQATPPQPPATQAKPLPPTWGEEPAAPLAAADSTTPDAAKQQSTELPHWSDVTAQGVAEQAANGDTAGAMRTAAQSIQQTAQANPEQTQQAFAAATTPDHPAAKPLISQLTSMFGGDGDAAQSAWDNMGTGSKFLLGLGAGFGLISLLQHLLGDDGDGLMSWLLPLVGGGAVGLLATNGQLPFMGGEQSPTTPAVQPFAGGLTPEQQQLVDKVKAELPFYTPITKRIFPQVAQNMAVQGLMAKIKEQQMTIDPALAQRIAKEALK